MSSFDAIRDALRPIEAEYRDDYQRIAMDAIEECNGAEDELHDRIWESVDGSWWVIYTYAAQIVCLVSENDGYSAENFGTESIVSDGGINWSAMAFGAMYADAMEYARIMLPDWLEAECTCEHEREAHADNTGECVSADDRANICPCEAFKAGDNA